MATDLVVGLTAFSAITLAALWLFSLGWIHLHAEYLARGLAFGTPLELGFAWFTAFTALPLLGATFFVASRALRIPRQVYHYIRGDSRTGSRARWASRRLVVRVSRPNYVASFWNGLL
jgi:TM2 domain-containing membrane protein YozV